jgi:hypothetical protein
MRPSNKPGCELCAQLFRRCKPVHRGRSLRAENQPQICDCLGQTACGDSLRDGWVSRNDELVLAALLNLFVDGRDGAFVIFDCQEYYVQFLLDIEHSKLLCEASSSRWLPSQPPLSSDAPRQLLTFGFQAPTPTNLNYHRVGSIVEAWDALEGLATMVVSIMRDVYGVSQTCDLAVYIALDG